MQAMDDLQEPTSDPRKAALGMLADGNSIASVADVFGLPPHVLEEWAREPRAPSPPASGEAIDATQTARQEHVAAPADDRRDRLHPLAGLAIAGTTLVFFLWSTVPIVVDSLHGTPPKDQLRRAAGWVRTWRDCYSLGRNTVFRGVRRLKPGEIAEAGLMRPVTVDGSDDVRIMLFDVSLLSTLK